MHMYKFSGVRKIAGKVGEEKINENDPNGRKRETRALRLEGRMDREKRSDVTRRA